MSNDPSNPWQPPPGPPPPGYGPPLPGYGPPPGYVPPGQPNPYGHWQTLPSNDRAGWALACGIVGLTACPPVGIAGIVLGKRAMQECRTSGQGGYGMAQVGFILGIIGTVLFGLTVLVVAFAFALAVGGA